MGLDRDRIAPNKQQHGNIQIAEGGCWVPQKYSDDARYICKQRLAPMSNGHGYANWLLMSGARRSQMPSRISRTSFFNDSTESMLEAFEVFALFFGGIGAAPGLAWLGAPARRHRAPLAKCCAALRAVDHSTCSC